MRLLALAFAAALVLPSAARADVLDFHFTPTDGVGGIYDFTSDQNPVTGQMATDGYFGINPVGTGGFLNGSDTIFFIDANNTQGYAGTIQLINSDFSIQVFLSGPQLFTGTVDAPTLSTGSFLLTNLSVPSPSTDMNGNVTVYPVPDGDQVGQSYNLVVTDISQTAVTPEPSSFVLLGTGALGLLGAARRRFIR